VELCSILNGQLKEIVGRIGGRRKRKDAFSDEDQTRSLSLH